MVSAFDELLHDERDEREEREQRGARERGSELYTR
jgi:hypothetical protein